MSELTNKLLKIASDIDSLIVKIASEAEVTKEAQAVKVEEEEASFNTIKTATSNRKSSNDFGSVSDYSNKSKNPLLDFILS